VAQTMTPTTAPDDRLLRWVTTRSIALSLLLLAGSFAFWRLPATLGIGCGAVLARGNFWLLRRMVTRMLGGEPGGLGRAIGLFGAKFLLLLWAVYAVMTYVPMDPVAFLVGISVVAAVIVSSSLLGPEVGSASGETGVANG